MTIFKEMDPELCWSAIQGHVDVLEPESRKMDVFYKAHKCPRCKSELQKEFDSRHAFSDPDVMVPRALLKCPTCSYTIDPHNNVIITYGDASKIPLDAYPMLKTE